MPHLSRVRVISICLSSANMYLTLIGVFPYTNRLMVYMTNLKWKSVQVAYGDMEIYFILMELMLCRCIFL